MIIYKKQSGHYNTQNLRHNNLIDFIERQKINRDLSVLDVGCGKGLLMNKLIELGYENIRGCDWKPIIDFRTLQVDLNLNGLKTYNDNSFDVIICSDVIEHLENPAFIFREFERVLKPNGYIFVTLPNAFNLFQRIAILLTGNSTRYKTETPGEYGHISMLSEWVLKTLLQRSGLQIRKTGRGFIYFKGFWFPDLKFSKLFSFNLYYMIQRK